MTVREIAAKMGVSPTTVSVVLNNKPGVRKELREKIAAVLEENGYVIKNTSQSSGTILLVYYKSTNFSAMRKDDILNFTLNAVQQVCDEEHFKFLFRTATSETLPRILLHNSEKVDGVVLLGTEFYHKPPSCFYETLLPLVILDRYIPDLPVNTVNIDNAQGINDLLKHIAEKGHHEIGYIKCRLDYGCTRDRANCVYAFARQYGLQLNTEHIVEADIEMAGAQIQIANYLNNTHHLPTAFVTDNDYLAIAAILAMMQKGLRIPEDVSVVGFDNSQVCSLFLPGLTTVEVDFTELARYATQQLIQLIQTPGRLPVKSTLGTHLIVRNSVKKIN